MEPRVRSEQPYPLVQAETDKEDKAGNPKVEKWNENRTVIYERDKGGRRGDIRYEDERRVVFMKMKDAFGKDCRKFIGVFKWKNTYKDSSDTIFVYERVASRVNIADLKNI